MSGIAGIVRFDGAPVEPGLIEKMTAAMAHRGPDGIRHWGKGSVALGQCMLCTTPESLEEAQPLANAGESLVLVMDGRLDNWQELRRELSGGGAVLRDGSDAELALRAYEAWGRECLAHMDGDFALAIWDARRRSLLCARDRLGMKPFNYHWNGTTLAFASELRAILALPWIERRLNEGLLAEYLANEWHTRDETPWHGIQRLVEAHWMEAGQSGLQTRPYWRPDLNSPLVYGSDEEYVEHYRALLTDTVRRQSRCHRPLACEVSGGLDSSAIFAVAAGLGRRHELLAAQLRGYTLLFDDDSAANELDYARAVSAHVGLPVREIEPTARPLAWYRNWAREYGEFPAYPNGVMSLGLKEAARAAGCRVILGGDGGDERLAGTRDYYVEELAAGRWRNLARCAAADLRAHGARQAAWWLARSIALTCLPLRLQGILRACLRRNRPAAAQGCDWLSPRLKALFEQRKAARDRRGGGVEFGRAGQVAQHEVLYFAFDGLAREMEERAAASLELELRQPFLSAAMVQFAFSTPERLRLRGATAKALHRSAMKGLLPASVLERTTKADFMVTFQRHAADMRRTVSEELLGSSQDWVLRPALESAGERFGDPSSDSLAEWKLWSLFGWRALQTEATMGTNPTLQGRGK